MTTETEHRSLGEEVAARVERRWATLSIVIVGVLVGMATFIGIHQATMPQGRVETADPQTLHLSGEFIESNLGSTVEADGSVTVRAVGQQYSFTPQCVVVPSNTPVTLRGIGHQGMWGKVKVVDQATFRSMMAKRRRLTCVD
jgi:cytochrome c oxidase subunit 2